MFPNYPNLINTMLNKVFTKPLGQHFWQASAFDHDTGSAQVETTERGQDIPDKGYPVATVYDHEFLPAIEHTPELLAFVMMAVGRYELENLKNAVHSKSEPASIPLSYEEFKYARALLDHIFNINRNEQR